MFSKQYLPERVNIVIRVVFISFMLLFNINNRLIENTPEYIFYIPQPLYKTRYSLHGFTTPPQ